MAKKKTLPKMTIRVGMIEHEKLTIHYTMKDAPAHHMTTPYRVPLKAATARGLKMVMPEDLQTGKNYEIHQIDIGPPERQVCLWTRAYEIVPPKTEQQKKAEAQNDLVNKLVDF